MRSLSQPQPTKSCRTSKTARLRISIHPSTRALTLLRKAVYSVNRQVGRECRMLRPASTCSQSKIASLEAKCCLLELHLQARTILRPTLPPETTRLKESGLAFPGDRPTRIRCTEDVLHQRLPLGSRIATLGRLCKVFGAASLLLLLENRATVEQT